MDNSSASSIAINVFVAPGEAFRALKEQPRFLLPLLILMAVQAALYFIYFKGVDFSWFVETMMSRSPRITEEQASEMGASVAAVRPLIIASIVAPFIAIFVAITLLVQALYFKIISLFARDGVTYGTWFGIVCFCGLPTALRSLTSISSMLVNDISLMPLEQANPLSFFSLLKLQLTGRPFESVVLNLDIMTVWSLGLLVIAHRIIAGRSLAGALATVVTPLALMVGLWLAS